MKPGDLEENSALSSMCRAVQCMNMKAA